MAVQDVRVEQRMPLPQQAGNEPQLSYDLVGAVARQRSFYYQVSRPYFTDPSFLKTSLMRYKGFLHLARILYSGKAGAREVFLVPTYDIDLFWHAHQLCPVAYQSDTRELMGQVFDHDDTDSDRTQGQKLASGYAATCDFWGDTFGFEYLRAGVAYRGEAPDPVEDLTVHFNGHSEPPDPGASPADWHLTQQAHLTARKLVEAYVCVLGAKNVDLSGDEGSKSYVQMKALKKCEDFKVRSPVVLTSANPVWRHYWNMDFETGTEGLVFQLCKKKGGVLKYLTNSKVIGEVAVRWTQLLDSPTLSFEGFLQLSSPTAVHSKPPALSLSVSITPPVPGPYLLRTKPLGKITDDNGVSVEGTRFIAPSNPQSGRWLSRTILDHTDREVYAVRIKVATGILERVPVATLIRTAYTSLSV
eukprot:TRINITY_DN8291_c0_g1_i1.p1 TRINITY_DN8291_c0_g1~~TRINITY_DN8291_c0_g1_i1.p1  ORF type:complete len:434 (+),score=45.05 TRINITY_DN8291_c0_g1_i1:60-1304(+)